MWEPSRGGPLLLVAGGSGIVPLMAMIRARAAARSDVDTRLLFSSRTWADVIYREEFERLNGDGLTVLYTLTRSQRSDWPGYARRVDAELLAEVGPDPAERPHVYVCGSTPFAVQVQRFLGHADPGFTLRTYVHLLDEDQPEVPLGDQVGNRWATGVAEYSRDAAGRRDAGIGVYARETSETPRAAETASGNS